jgi:nicotinate-nucleotide adenylyltransferase
LLVISVGVLGGSFDPVHRGHLALASQALRTFRLSQVLLLPCAQPPHKPGRALAAPHHRLEMLYLAAEDRPGLQISTLEIAQGGVHFTIDTLRALRANTPSVGPVFLCGSDALAEVASWREYQSLLAEFDFAAVIRPSDRGEPREPHWPDDVARRLSPFPPGDAGELGAGGRVYRLDMPALAISSSLVRERRAAGQPVEDLVPARVARYIQRHRLYVEEGPR